MPCKLTGFVNRTVNDCGSPLKQIDMARLEGAQAVHQQLLLTWSEFQHVSSSGSSAFLAPYSFLLPLSTDEALIDFTQAVESSVGRLASSSIAVSRPVTHALAPVNGQQIQRHQSLPASDDKPSRK